MPLVSLSHIAKKFDDQVVLDDVSFAVDSGVKIGLVGRNGSGKTTLHDIILQKLAPDSGAVDFQKEVRIGAVRQELSDEMEFSVYDFCYRARPELNDIRLQMARLDEELNAESPPPQLVIEYQQLVERYEALGGYRQETETKLVLEGMGFPQSQFERRLSSFSGGERNRAQLAAVLAGTYDLYLLDEPTNHLDIESTIWLENHIAASSAAYMIISHDRRFLEGVVTKVIELAFGQVEIYHTGFSGYLEEREARRAQAEHQYRHQQEEIARIEQFIRKNIAGQKTKQAQSRQKYLARLQRSEKPKTDMAAPKFHILDGGRSFLQVLRVENLAVGYNGQPLLCDIEFSLNRGDRVGLIGPNGSGKSTILKTLTGDLEPLDGDITVGRNVEMVFFDQELSNLNQSSDILSELWEVDPLAEAGRLRSFLARFGFTGEDIFKPVALLSGGEKTKLALAKILYRPANFLIFDEPTNHLDMTSIEALENGLREYNGSLLVVSHDRYFLDRVVTSILAVEGGSVRPYIGNYSDYAEKKRPEVPKAKEVTMEKKLAYESFKQKSREKSRHKKKLQQLNADINHAEKRLTELHHREESIDTSDWQGLADLQKEKSTLENQLLDLYADLERVKNSAPD
jgi:ATP-binding cassette subfamily F protein 3